MGVEYLEGQILELRHELYQLKGILGKKDLEIGQLKAEITKLLKENKELGSNLIKLEDKLNINSGNSGLPTSKEIYRIERKSRIRSGLKGGGQAGQKPRSYEFKVPDQIVEVKPEEKSCKCGGKLIPLVDYKSYQKIEIPPVKPVVTEYRLHSSSCIVCQKKYRAKLDNYKLLGKNSESIIATLGGFFNNSKREIQSILSQIFNLDISLGLISASEGRVSVKLEDKYNELMARAQNSDYLHLDESSANDRGKRGWCRVAASKDVTVFKLANSRGRKIVEQLLPEYGGKVITDRYGVYNIFGNERRQVCLAHLRRDFKRFAHSKNLSLSKVGHSLIDITDRVFALYHGYKEEKIDRFYYQRKMRKVKKKMLYYLKTISGLEECEQARRVANNILKTFDMMWLFLDHEQIEPTNNFAERQIKHHVKYRKNSLFTWSDRGQRFIERMKSIYATAKLQNQNPHHQILSLI